MRLKIAHPEEEDDAEGEVRPRQGVEEDEAADEEERDGVDQPPAGEAAGERGVERNGAEEEERLGGRRVRFHLGAAARRGSAPRERA